LIYPGPALVDLDRFIHLELYLPLAAMS